MNIESNTSKYTSIFQLKNKRLSNVPCAFGLPWLPSSHFTGRPAAQLRVTEVEDSSVSPKTGVAWIPLLEKKHRNRQ